MNTTQVPYRVPGGKATTVWMAPPVGYGVYEIDGTEVNWYFKSVGKPRDHQMRIYAPGTTGNYGNDVVVNIWNWDKNWQVQWQERWRRHGCNEPFRGDSIRKWRKHIATKESSNSAG